MLVVGVVGLVKVIFTGEMWGGRELAMLCMMLLILGLPLTGTVMVFEIGGMALGTSLSITGVELEELVRRRLRGFSSSSAQLTPGPNRRMRRQNISSRRLRSVCVHCEGSVFKVHWGIVYWWYSGTVYRGVQQDVIWQKWCNRRAGYICKNVKNKYIA